MAATLSVLDRFAEFFQMQMVTFLTPFVNKLLQSVRIFHVFWFKWPLLMVSDICSVDA